jgi:hypothetical protein
MAPLKENNSWITSISNDEYISLLEASMQCFIDIPKYREEMERTLRESNNR